MKITDTPTPLTTETEAETGRENIVPLPSEKGLSPAVQKHIGNLLKVSYQDLLTEAVPDRFAQLLDQLEQAEKKGK